MHPTATRKLLLIELWGLGDLTFATAIIPALRAKYQVTVLAKAHARPLLAPSFPTLDFIEWDAPWTAFRDKYRFRRWNWRELLSIVNNLQGHHFEHALSVRDDPRDHALMWLSRVSERHGFPRKGSNLLLTHSLASPGRNEHRVERWRRLAEAVGCASEHSEPRLNHAAYRSARIDQLWDKIRRPVFCLHAGARIATRRWPESSFAYILERVRAAYSFDILLLPDPDGYGAALAPLADHVIDRLSIGELVDLLGRVDLLFSNDSAPAHLAAACGRPVISVFGPTHPAWFHPWNNRERVILRDICPWRPCFDNCKFSEPHCLTKLLPELVWTEIKTHIDAVLTSGSAGKMSADSGTEMSTLP